MGVVMSSSTGEGTKLSDRHCSILPYHVGRRGFGLPFWGVRSPCNRLSVMVLTAQVPDGMFGALPK
jgi:hypothetical protein